MPEERSIEYMLTGLANSGWSVVIGAVETHRADGHAVTTGTSVSTARYSWADGLYVHYTCKVVADKEDSDQIVGECQNGRTPEDAITRAMHQAWEKVTILALLSLGQVKVPG